MRGLSIGMNGRIFPPNVPSAFLWKDTGIFNDANAPYAKSVSFTERDYGASSSSSSSSGSFANTVVTPPSGAEIVTLWNPRGYGGLGQYVTVPGMADALAYDWRGDNAGPPSSVAEVVQGYNTVRQAFPNATVISSTLDAFVEKLWESKDSLPVLSQEVGDSWIWGCAQDPTKQQNMRALYRARAAVLNSTSTAPAAARPDGAGADAADADVVDSVDDPSIYNFSRQLVKGSEHTWGISVRTYGKFLNGPYTNAEFHANRKDNEDFVSEFEAAWIGQRKLTVDYPMQALPDGHSLKTRANNELAKVSRAASVAPDPSAEGFLPVPTVDTPLTNLAGWCDLTLSAADGSIVRLNENDGGGSKEWANSTYPMALLRYQSLIDADMTAWRKEYLIQDCPSEYGKPGCMLAKPTPTHQLLPPTPSKLWIKNSSSTTGNAELLMVSTFDARLHDNYGAPSTVWTRFEIERDAVGKTRGIEITVTLINKTSTRLPEAMFFTHNPRPLVGVRPPPPPPPPPPPTPPGTEAVQRGLVSLQSPGGGAGMVTVPVTFKVPFDATVTPIVVATPLQGSTGGGANNNATFLAVVRTVSSTGFTVSVEVVGDGAVWNQESTLSYIAATPGHVNHDHSRRVSSDGRTDADAAVVAIAGHGDVGAMLNKTMDPASKTVSFTFPTSLSGAALQACESNPAVSLVLTPQTTRGASNTDVYALSVATASCTGATLVATRVCGVSNCDSFWGEDLQFNYIAFFSSSSSSSSSRGAGNLPATGAPTREDLLRAVVPSGGHRQLSRAISPAVQTGTASATLDTVATITVAFPTPFAVDTDPTVLATAALSPTSSDGRSVALSMVSVDANGFTVALEMLAARHPSADHHHTAYNLLPATVNVLWAADGSGQGPSPPPPSPPSPNPSPIPDGTGSLWAMDKLGELVSPLNLVDGGSKGLHGITSGVMFTRKESEQPSSNWQRIFFTSPDAGIVAWDSPTPFPTPIHRQPDMSYGASLMLFDNIWNTNYINWWPFAVPGENYGNSTFRFGIKLVD